MKHQVTPAQTVAAAVVVVAVQFDDGSIRLCYGPFGEFGPITDLHQWSIPNARLLDCAVGQHGIFVLVEATNGTGVDATNVILHEYLMPPAMRSFWDQLRDPVERVRAQAPASFGGPVAGESPLHTIYEDAEFQMVVQMFNSVNPLELSAKVLSEDQLWVQHGVVLKVGSAVSEGRLVRCSPPDEISRLDGSRDSLTTHAFAGVNRSGSGTRVRYWVEGGMEEIHANWRSTFEDAFESGIYTSTKTPDVRMPLGFSRPAGPEW